MKCCQFIWIPRSYKVSGLWYCKMACGIEKRNLIGRVNIGIIFLCIRTLSQSLICCSTLSQMFWKLIGQYWKIVRRQLQKSSCHIVYSLIHVVIYDIFLYINGFINHYWYATSEECIYNQFGITYYCLLTGCMQVIAITGYSVPILELQIACNKNSLVVCPDYQIIWMYYSEIKVYLM